MFQFTLNLLLYSTYVKRCVKSLALPFALIERKKKKLSSFNAVTAKQLVVIVALDS